MRFFSCVYFSFFIIIVLLFFSFVIYSDFLSDRRAGWVRTLFQRRYGVTVLHCSRPCVCDGLRCLDFRLTVVSVSMCVIMIEKLMRLWTKFSHWLEIFGSR